MKLQRTNHFTIANLLVTPKSENGFVIMSIQLKTLNALKRVDNGMRSQSSIKRISWAYWERNYLKLIVGKLHSQACRCTYLSKQGKYDVLYWSKQRTIVRNYVHTADKPIHTVKIWSLPHTRHMAEVKLSGIIWQTSNSHCLT